CPTPCAMLPQLISKARALPLASALCNPSRRLRSLPVFDHPDGPSLPVPANAHAPTFVQVRLPRRSEGRLGPSPRNELDHDFVAHPTVSNRLNSLSSSASRAFNGAAKASYSGLSKFHRCFCHSSPSFVRTSLICITSR